MDGNKVQHKTTFMLYLKGFCTQLIINHANITVSLGAAKHLKTHLFVAALATGVDAEMQVSIFKPVSRSIQ